MGNTDLQYLYRLARTTASQVMLQSHLAYCPQDYEDRDQMATGIGSIIWRDVRERLYKWKPERLGAVASLGASINEPNRTRLVDAAYKSDLLSPTNGGR